MWWKDGKKPRLCRTLTLFHEAQSSVSLQMPYEPDPRPDASTAERLAFGRNQKVRHTVIAVITAHLQPEASASWQRCILDNNRSLREDKLYYVWTLAKHSDISIV